jgi:hypothetical protein
MRISAVLLLALLALGCRRSSSVQHRERSPDHDKECAEPNLPRAYFYPAQNRTDYGPDDPRKDGCALLVPDHLFCCPGP